MRIFGFVFNTICKPPQSQIIYTVIISSMITIKPHYYDLNHLITRAPGTCTLSTCFAISTPLHCHNRIRSCMTHPHLVYCMVRGGSLQSNHHITFSLIFFSTLFPIVFIYRITHGSHGFTTIIPHHHTIP
jgi:hypothetical protein